MRKNIEAIDLHVGNRLRIARDMRGLTRPVMADEIGISQSMIHKWEAGKGRLFVNNLWRVAQFLEVPLEFFFAEFPGEKKPGSTPDGEKFMSAVGLLSPAALVMLERMNNLTNEQQRTVRNLVAVMQPKD